MRGLRQGPSAASASNHSPVCPFPLYVVATPLCVADTMAADGTLVGLGGSVDSDVEFEIINPGPQRPWEVLMATVLIIDDDLDIQLLVRLVLEGAGLTIVGEATNGVDGLRLWRDLNGPPDPDVVILDNQMPGMTGLDVAARILAERPTQIIVMCTSFLHPGIQTAAAEIGIARCLPKRELQLLPALVQQLIDPGIRAGAGRSQEEPQAV